MTQRFARTAALLALAVFSTCACAQTVLQTEGPGQVVPGDGVLQTEPPGRVGRIALVQGEVGIGGGVGAESASAVVNWPVTARNLVTTAPGARTEIRIGSTSVWLDGDSALEFTELDDDKLHLRLHFGSAGIRVVNGEVVPEFELRTAQATVRLTEPGRLRVDADRVPDTSLVSVFDGQALVDGAGASLTIRAGRSAEVRDEDVRTLQAQRDEFDDWALARDQTLVAEQSARHVGTEMTGYEELDRHGSWSTHPDYGSLWTPGTVGSDWTPYRDGQWNYIAPWGWTWVDNAPWGYAPFHYGRWVQAHNRWAWAPGRLEQRPLWAPALVGWVGGANWSVGFASRHLPAHGWYPLSPHDHFVPGYRLSDARLRRLNDWRHVTGRVRHRPGQHHGLTVVPREHFVGRGQVVVPRAPRPDRPPQALPHGQGSAPPPPPLVVRAGLRGEPRDAWRNVRREKTREDQHDGRHEDRRAVVREEQREERRDVVRHERRDGWRDDRLDRRPARLDTGSVTRDRFQVARGQSEPDPMARQRESNARLARERAQQQERQQGERERMQRDLDERLESDRMRFQREREQRERTRERTERPQRQLQPGPPGAPSSGFLRPEPRPATRPDPRPATRPDPRPDPRPGFRPHPRPPAAAQVAAPPPARPQAASGFAPRRAERRAHTDERGHQIQER